MNKRPSRRAASTLFVSTLAVALSACSNSEPDLNRFEAWDASESPLSSEGRARLESFLVDNGSSSYLMIYQGKVAYSYGDIHRKHLIHSMRKPILSLLFGAAVASGDVDLNETVATLDLAEDGTPFTDDESLATVEQLLQSRSGIYLPAAAETDSMKAGRPERGSHKPGEAYYYNNWSFNSVGTVFEQRTGKSIYEAFAETFAEPLGMTSYTGKTTTFTLEDGDGSDLPLEGLDGFYLVEPANSRHPAYHFRLSAHDLALIGQLLVNDGTWNDQQILPAEWIDQSTDCYTVMNENIGGGRSLCYGMMWEIVRQDGTMSAFLHTGLGVHMIYVHPGAELVMIHRVDTEGDYSFPNGRIPQLIGLSFGAFN